MASRQDLDNWSELGNKGWGFDDMMPYYRKFETYHRCGDEFADKVNDKYLDATLRGTSGPIQVRSRMPFSCSRSELSRSASPATTSPGPRTCGRKRSSMQATNHRKIREVVQQSVASTNSTRSTQSSSGGVTLPESTTSQTPAGQICRC